jgi:hypothetical protein
MLQHVGFQDVQRISPEASAGGIFRAKAKVQEKGHRPDEMLAPWS